MFTCQASSNIQRAAQNYVSLIKYCTVSLRYSAPNLILAETPNLILAEGPQCVSGLTCTKGPKKCTLFLIVCQNKIFTYCALCPKGVLPQQEGEGCQVAPKAWPCGQFFSQ